MTALIGSRIDVRVVRGETGGGRPMHEARFVCGRCGWTTRSSTSGHRLVIPRRVHDHNRLCAGAEAA